MGAVSVLKTDIRGGTSTFHKRKERGIAASIPLYIIRCQFAGYELELKYKQKASLKFKEY